MGTLTVLDILDRIFLIWISKLMGISILNKSIRNLFPLHKHERFQFTLFVILMFCILFAQNLIRNIKDVVVGHDIGFEVNNILKSYGVIPASFLFSIIYIKAVTLYRNSRIFLVTYITFIILFVIYGFILIPNAHSLNLYSSQETTDLINTYPKLKWFIIVASNWVLSTFYIFCEMWSTVMYSQLFWQMVNSCTTVEQSKRFYIPFSVFGQMGLVGTAIVLINFDSIIDTNTGIGMIPHWILQYCDSTNAGILYSQSIILFIIFISIIGVMVLCIINNYVIDCESLDSIQIRSNQKHPQLLQSLKFILQSRYVFFLFTILVCYGISVNMVEGYWKAQVRKVVVDSREFSRFFAYILLYNGLLTTFFSLIGRPIIQTFGWLKTALITPVIVLITGGVFFSLALYLKYVTHEILQVSSLMIIIGAIQNVLIKSCKYALFDSTKEMLYVPLDHETKTKGKAVAIIGNRMGKGLSGIVKASIILPLAGSYDNTLPVLIPFFIIPCLIWIYSVKELNKDYIKKQQEV